MNSKSTSELPSFQVLLAVIGCMVVFTLLLGLSYPLLTVLLNRQGYEESLIGLNSAMAPLGIVVSAPILPKLAQRWGAYRFVVISVFGVVITFLLIGATRDIYAWFPLRFFLGVFMSGAFIVSETWINQLASDATRGRILGIYAMSISGGFALGPLLLAIAGAAGWTPFLLGAGIAFLALIPLLLARHNLPKFESTEVSMWSFFGKAPLLLFFVFAIGAFDQVIMVFSPIYFLYKGLDESTMAIALTVLICGNMFSQPLVGWLLDHIGIRPTAIGCILATLVGCLLVPYSFGYPVFFWGLLFLWGGAGFGLYTVSLTELGHRFRGALLLAGNAAFGAIWGISGMIMAPVTGQTMQVFGPQSLLHIVFAVFAIALVWTAVSPSYRRR